MASETDQPKLIHFCAGQGYVFDSSIEAQAKAEELGRGYLNLGTISVVPVIPKWGRPGLRYSGNIAHRRTREREYPRRDTASSSDEQGLPISDWTLGVDPYGNSVITVAPAIGRHGRPSFPTPKTVVGRREVIFGSDNIEPTGEAGVNWVELSPSDAEMLFNLQIVDPSLVESSAIPLDNYNPINADNSTTDPEPTIVRSINRDARRLGEAITKAKDFNPGLFDAGELGKASRRAVLQKVFPLTAASTKAWFPTFADRVATQRREVTDGFTRAQWLGVAALSGTSGVGMGAAGVHESQNNDPVSASVWGLGAAVFTAATAAAVQGARTTGRGVSLTNWTETAKRGFTPKKRPK
jgi:hypothetical protein